uniref:Uncharacterized protein n=1 Tax=Caenorhabditis japonica TaxID=281687 RepID=A0A8R1E682_CAEJA
MYVCVCIYSSVQLKRCRKDEWRVRRRTAHRSKEPLPPRTAQPKAETVETARRKATTRQKKRQRMERHARLAQKPAVDGPVEEAPREEPTPRPRRTLFYDPDVNSVDEWLRQKGNKWLTEDRTASDTYQKCSDIIQEQREAAATTRRFERELRQLLANEERAPGIENRKAARGKRRKRQLPDLPGRRIRRAVATPHGARVFRQTRATIHLLHENVWKDSMPDLHPSGEGPAPMQICGGGVPTVCRQRIARQKGPPRGDKQMWPALGTRPESTARTDLSGGGPSDKTEREDVRVLDGLGHHPPERLDPVATVA